VPVAALGPALLVKVKMTLLPTFGVALFTVLTMLTLACGTGTGVLVDVLFNGWLPLAAIAVLA
jgi:hypothetical protein